MRHHVTAITKMMKACERAHELLEEARWSGSEEETLQAIRSADEQLEQLAEDLRILRELAWNEHAAEERMRPRGSLYDTILASAAQAVAPPPPEESKDA